MHEPLVMVHNDADRLATEVAAALLERLAAAQDDGRLPQIALAGGTIAGRVHRAVAALSPGHRLDWSRVVIWWGDERFVAPDSPERNARHAHEDLLQHVGVDPANVHEMPSTADAPDVGAAAVAYGQTIKQFGADHFEVLMLGVGPDGHVASLFPGFPQLDADDIAVGVTGSPKPPPERVSLTFAALNHARAVWMLVSGAEKADAVAAALAGDDLHSTPATGVRGSSETVWHLDPAAASRLR